MTIRDKTILPTSPLRDITRQVKCWFPANQAAYILGSTASSAMTVGTALTLLETWTRGNTSIAITPGQASTSAFTFDVVGLNQFGVQVGESITTGTSANIVHTLKCYSKIISITPTAKSSTGADTVTIGWTGVVTSGTPRVALPCRPTSTASIKNMTLTLASGTLPTFTAETANYTIAVSAQPLFPATVGGFILCNMDIEDGNL